MPPDAAVCMAAITGKFDGSEAWHTMSSVFFARERATFMRRLSRKNEGRAPSTTQLSTTWGQKTHRKTHATAAAAQISSASALRRQVDELRQSAGVHLNPGLFLSSLSALST